MNLEIETRDDTTVVRLPRLLDTRASAVIYQQLRPIAQSVDRLVLDMTGVELIASSGLNMLVGITYRYRSPTTKIAMVGVHERVLATLAMAGLADMVPIYRTLAEGLAAVAAEATSHRL
jgi:anti-anti-sigma factor